MPRLENNTELSEPKESPASDFRSDSRWAVIERILLSAPFQKSSSLRALLSYLGEYSIKGKAEALTERQIGIAVFGKPAGYSPVEDSTVRVHMRQLRLRLYEYFALDGRHEALHVKIPKGNYTLEFRDAEPEISAAPVLPPEAKPEIEKPRKGRPWQILFWIAAVAAVVCAIGWYRLAREYAQPIAPWPISAVIQPGQQTRIVVSDSSLMLRQLGQQEITLDNYLQPDYRKKLIPENLPANFDRLLNYIAGSQLTSFADLTTVSNLMKLAGSLGTQIVLTSARDLDRRDLEHGNYVFVGGPTSNPWVALFSDKLNFQVIEQGVGGRMYFQNRNPLPGEQKEYEGLASTGSTGEDYATVSVLPGQMGQGNVMILQGLRQDGTEALSAMLADAGDRARLQQAVEHSSGSPSPYFEALIRSQTVAGAPVSVAIVAVRRIQP